ncbi:MAG: LytTR family DNA-binding domain-containing protein [Bacteroidota bacterium]
MKVVIIEDESQAAQMLMQQLESVDPTIEVVMVLESVHESVKYFKANSHPDLIFSDIQLEDGLSFGIYEKVKVQCPIVFTTAYNQYAIQAFQTNGIGYLLKPIDQEQLDNTLRKFRELTPGLAIDKIIAMASSLSKEKSYKTRFLVKAGEKIKTVLVSDVAAFYSVSRVTYIITFDLKKHIVDYSLDQLEKIIDPDHFFRINRKTILSIDSCNDLQSWSSSRLKVNLPEYKDVDTVVSRDRYREFKNWLDR